MRVRDPVVAGKFYQSDAMSCRQAMDALLVDACHADFSSRRLFGGLVPHAGWSYSGAVAATVFSTLAESFAPDVIVMFGGVHRSMVDVAAMYCDGKWNTPIGPVPVDERLAGRILEQTNLIVDNACAHEQEHSLEVQMPFIASLFPYARVVPIMVKPGPKAEAVGEAVGSVLQTYEYKAMVVGTTDLTHYGPNYGFVPEGVGGKANLWARLVNDRRFIELVQKMRSECVVDEAQTHKNACSSGAVAATLAAVKKVGAHSASVLAQTSSAEVVIAGGGREPSDSVGYVGMVFE